MSNPRLSAKYLMECQSDICDPNWYYTYYKRIFRSHKFESTWKELVMGEDFDEVPNTHPLVLFSLLRHTSSYC